MTLPQTTSVVLISFKVCDQSNRIISVSVDNRRSWFLMKACSIGAIYQKINIQYWCQPMLYTHKHTQLDMSPACSGCSVCAWVAISIGSHHCAVLCGILKTNILFMKKFDCLSFFILLLFIIMFPFVHSDISFGVVLAYSQFLLFR